MLRWVTGLALAAMLAGCGQAAEQAAQSGTFSSESAAAPSAAPTAGAASDVAQAPAGQRAAVPVTPGAEVPGTPAGLPMLAYSYRYTLETPNDRVASLMRRHEQQCVQAGPALCQVLGAQLDTNRDTEAQTGTLNLRAQPAWLTTFRGALDREAQAAGGRVAASNTSTEDLTRQIVDTEAHLRARTTLRDRMQELLATRSGTLQELVYLEQELSRVQGELDATASALSVMRTRIATSALTVEYRSRAAAVSEGTWRPLSEASDSFLNNFVGALAVVVTLLSWLLPLLLIGGLVFWIVTTLRRRGRERRAERAARAQRTGGATTPPPA